MVTRLQLSRIRTNIQILIRALQQMEDLCDTGLITYTVGGVTREVSEDDINTLVAEIVTLATQAIVSLGVVTDV